MISDRVRAWTRGLANGLAQIMDRLGFTPNMLTVLGFLLMIPIGVLLAAGYFRAGAIFILLAGAFDGLDGALARLTDRVTSFGGFLDSTLDRYAEGVLYLGLLVFYQRHPDNVAVVLVYLTIVGSLLVSYTRARAEGAGIACKVGVFTRFERIAVLVLGLFSGWMLPALAILALFSHITALQRIWHVFRQARNAGQP
ncbi:MAG: CDP-alcohol phosphatidyltransferase family protein [Chloroflexi bacterium]|nr:CDP-alcohol phosphatidyltransferase family protein [Chloroflexota bacterium]